MAHYSVADAKNNLSRLIERALDGEEVVITRHGQPVVQLQVTGRRAPRPPSREDVEWVIRHRIKNKMPREDVGALLRRMRDEDWR